MLKNRHFCIVNTAKKGETGQHWFVVLKHEKQYELFDSLGQGEKYLTELNISGKLTFNTTVLQGSNTDTCGAFCLYYIVHRLLNFDLDFEEFMNDFFSASLSVNDRNIARFLTSVKIENIFGD